MSFSSFTQYFLVVSLLIPMSFALLMGIGSVLNLFPTERSVARLTKVTYLSYLGSVICTILAWLLSGGVPVKLDLGSIFKTGDYSFSLTFYFDLASAAFLGLVAMISNVITFYSHSYLHRDPGYRRFFTVISLFVFGLSLIVTSGSFDLLFAGWEIVGFSSFLLISFYWTRPQAVENANRAYVIYRVCDLGLLVGAWMAHLIWHKANLFYEFNQAGFIPIWAQVPIWEQWSLGFLILLAVLGKSAQFPFLFWLPRAMEGPTPSSAIFYGALSIHAGVFLLIRTFPMWSPIDGFALCVGFVGLITAALSVFFGRVQTNIKGQIGYASITQVGIMLVELAFGFPDFALIHVIGNASLRCFQLLISPSIISQQLQIQSSLDQKALDAFVAPGTWSKLVPKKLRSSLYVFATNEGFLEQGLKWAIVFPLCRLAALANQGMGRLRASGSPTIGSLGFAYRRSWFSLLVFCLPFLVGILGMPFFRIVPSQVLQALLLFSILFFSLSAFGEFKDGKAVLDTVVVSDVFVALAIVSHDAGTLADVSIYLLGLAFSWILALTSLTWIFKHRQVESLKIFSGLMGQFPLAGHLFLVGLMGMVGFPLFVTFIGEDLLVHHALANSFPLALILTFVFVMNGITLVRLYSRVLLGKKDAEIKGYDCDYTSGSAAIRLGIFAFCNFIPFGLRMFHFFGN